MLETMPEFLSRIGNFQFDSVPVEEIFGLTPAVYQKVEQGTGRYLPFFGNTIIYYLDDSALAMCDFATKLPGRQVVSVLLPRRVGAMRVNHAA